MPRLALSAALIALTVMAAPSLQAATFNTLSGNAPKIIAHRGVPAYEPENSLSGYVKSMELGADLLETDVQSTADGVVILMHDTTLTRTTDVAVKFPDRAGDPVSSFTAAEIATLRLKTVDGTGVTDAPVPTLAAFLDTVAAYNTANGTEIGVLVEAKDPAGTPTVQASMDLMAAKGFDTPAKGQVQAFSTQNVVDMAAVDAASPDVDFFVAQLGLGVLPFPVGGGATAPFLVSAITFDADDNIVPTDFAPLAAIATYTDAIAMFEPQLTPEVIALAHSLGLEVYGWTFRFASLDEARARMAPFIAAGLDGFITDQTDLARAALMPAPIPLPGALPLLASGIAALTVLRRRRAA